MTKKTNIIEIFSSIQGEGPYIGCRQIFIRFSGCNLSCNYCDTEFAQQKTYNQETHAGSQKFKKIDNPVSADELLKNISDLMNVPHHSISLTGGEPLLHTEFLSDFLPKFKKAFPKTKIYLETNGTLNEKLRKIIENIDIISMDVKLKSSTGTDFPTENHKKFIETAQNFNSEIFIKAVITNKITNNEICELTDFINRFGSNLTLILQPVSSENKDILLTSKNMLEIQEKFLEKIQDARIIPQTHKFFDLY